uniref:Reverse transcriptase zinc-binding domain-containing protein n=1 Tax=Manihot esculenta TaxID=3983 RepID=A0A2C9VK42_MANES
MSIRAEPGSSSSHRSRDMWKGLWNLKLPLKLTIFMWKFLQDRLLTNEQLNGKISSFPVECAFCGEKQSLVHLFFNCPRVMRI